MYRAYFEYSESKDSLLYKNLIKKIIPNGELNSSNMSISDNTFLPGFSKIEIQLEILEDFTYELKSNFASYKEVLGEISSFAGSIIGFFDKLSAANGAFSQINSRASDSLKVQVWKETEPFKMNFKFSLQTKTNPFVDVYLPAILLCSQTILSPISGSTDYLRTPGVNSRKIEKSIVPDAKSKAVTFDKNTLTPKERNASSKVLDTFAILVRKIDSTASSKMEVSDTEYRTDESTLTSYNPLMSMDYAFIETAKPTWSKERTESGIPLWCELELTVQSVFSANDSMFAYMYPEADEDLLSREGVRQVSGKLYDAGTSKARNIFR